MNSEYVWMLFRGDYTDNGWDYLYMAVYKEKPTEEQLLAKKIPSKYIKDLLETEYSAELELKEPLYILKKERLL